VLEFGKAFKRKAGREPFTALASGTPATVRFSYGAEVLWPAMSLKVLDSLALAMELGWNDIVGQTGRGNCPPDHLYELAPGTTACS